MLGLLIDNLNVREVEWKMIFSQHDSLPSFPKYLTVYVGSIIGHLLLFLSGLESVASLVLFPPHYQSM